MGNEQTTERGLTALVGRMADGFSKLVSQHIQLARAELAEDVRGMGLDVARIAVFVPFVLVGYTFVCGALAALLASWVGWAGALALVGGLNLVGGGVGIYRAAQSLRARHVMDDTTQELTRSVSALGALQGAAAAQVPQAPPPAPPGAAALQPAPARNTLKEQPHGR